MNYTYILSLALVLWLFVYSIYKGRDVFIFGLSLVALCVMGVLQFAPMFDGSNVTTRAISYKINNEIIVQSDGNPTQIVTDLKFVDVPLQVRKVNTKNAWGFYTGTPTYTVEIIQP